jgi:hypothetical protein
MSVPPLVTNTLIVLLNQQLFQDHELSQIRHLFSFKNSVPLRTIITLKGMGRVLIVYEKNEDAKRAREQYHGWNFSSAECTLRVYYGEHTKPEWLDPDPSKRMSYLSIPKPSKNFLLSPPGFHPSNRR